MSRLNEILKYTKELFPSPEYETLHTNHGIVVNDKNNKLCTRFMIYGTTIYIEEIAKCEQMNGTASLLKLLEIYKKFNATTIYLTDAAEIHGENCSFKVYLMQILSTGNSWYNKHGFISDEYEKELLNNSSLLGLTVRDFVEQYMKGINVSQTSKLQESMEERFIKNRFGVSLSEKNLVMDEINRIPEFLDRSIKDVTREIISTYMKNGIINCTGIPILRWFTFLLIIAQQLVLYKRDLTYNPHEKEEIERKIQGPKTGGKRKKKTSIRKTRKHKTRKRII